MARYVRIDKDGDLSIDKVLKNPWKFSWLEEEQNIEDLLATPSSEKVYYWDFLEKINKHGFAKCIYVELTQFPRTAKSHGQYHEPRSGEVELRSSETEPLSSDSVGE